MASHLVSKHESTDSPWRGGRNSSWPRRNLYLDDERRIKMPGMHRRNDRKVVNDQLRRGFLDLLMSHVAPILKLEGEKKMWKEFFC